MRHRRLGGLRHCLFRKFEHEDQITGAPTHPYAEEEADPYFLRTSVSQTVFPLRRRRPFYADLLASPDKDNFWNFGIKIKYHNLGNPIRDPLSRSNASFTIVTAL